MDIRTIVCGKRNKTSKRVLMVAGGVAAAAVVAGIAFNIKSIKRYVKISLCM